MQPATPRDGYTRRAYLKALPPLHGPVRFDFRPAALVERYEFVDKQQGQASKARAENAAKFVAAKLVRWDLKDAAGEAVPRTAVALLDPAKVDPNLFLRLLNVVLGVELWDDDPDLEPAQKDEDVEAVAAAAKEEGVTPGEHVDGRDRKN